MIVFRTRDALRSALEAYLYRPTTPGCFSMKRFTTSPEKPAYVNKLEEVAKMLGSDVKAVYCTSRTYTMSHIEKVVNECLGEFEINSLDTDSVNANVFLSLVVTCTRGRFDSNAIQACKDKFSSSAGFVEQIYEKLGDVSQKHPNGVAGNLASIPLTVGTIPGNVSRQQLIHKTECMRTTHRPWEKCWLRSGSTTIPMQSRSTMACKT